MIDRRPMRPGRPAIAAKQGQKATLGIRATAELKDRLIAAANRNDRSLSQEAELRLERSFEFDSVEAFMRDLAQRLGFPDR